MYIVVEVTQRPDQPENVNFEPIIRGLKSDVTLRTPTTIVRNVI